MRRIIYIYTMLKNLYIFLLKLSIALLISSCNSNKNGQSAIINHKANSKLYNALNQLFDSDSLHRKDLLLVKESIRVYKTQWGDDYFLKSANPTEPPPPLVLYITLSELNTYVDKKLLRLDEVNSMYAAIDSSKALNFEANHLAMKGVSSDSLSIFFIGLRKKGALRGEIYQNLKNWYGRSTVLQISSPVFSKDSTKLLVLIKLNSNSKSLIYKYLLESKLEKWRIVNKANKEIES